MTDKLPVHAVATALFSVAPEQVFDAFLNTEMIGQFMFGPQLRDEEIVSLSNNPWEGGSFSYVVRRQGEEINHAGKYLEVKRPNRLVFSWQVMNDPSDYSVVLIEIVPIIAGCELTLTHEMPGEWKDYVEQTKAAWGKMLDKLTEILQ
ncbi:SRPBCC domain-containing protein [uncultured Chitinophaga sp.]|jgi:Uncharacterized conserved protein|uniref:SRPBCC family protein n=1 Tax=uncultured Chitinophaga sp. TaxID=339340 RepID=UPI00262CEAA0|nr:SRPBCC domain-containing protein [uncultured Chitinophaga sp.]